MKLVRLAAVENFSATKNLSIGFPDRAGEIDACLSASRGLGERVPQLTMSLKVYASA